MTQAGQEYNKMVYVPLAWPSGNYTELLQRQTQKITCNYAQYTNIQSNLLAS